MIYKFNDILEEITRGLDKIEDNLGYQVTGHYFDKQKSHARVIIDTDDICIEIQDNIISMIYINNNPMFNNMEQLYTYYEDHYRNLYS